MLRFLLSKTNVFIVFLLCLLELLAVKNKVKLEKKQHMEKKASELYLAKVKSSKKLLSSFSS